MLYVGRIRQEFRIGIAVFFHHGRFGTACGKLDLQTLENQETRHTEIFLFLLLLQTLLELL
jgi:hypothetical protein